MSKNTDGDDVFGAIGREIDRDKPVGGDGFGAAPAVAGSTVAGVMRGLRGAGMSFLDIVKWLPVILQLVAELGPQVAEIVRRIREAFEGGQRPETFKTNGGQ